MQTEVQIHQKMFLFVVISIKNKEYYKSGNMNGTSPPNNHLTVAIRKLC